MKRITIEEMRNIAKAHSGKCLTWLNLSLTLFR